MLIITPKKIYLLESRRVKKLFYLFLHRKRLRKIAKEILEHFRVDM